MWQAFVEFVHDLADTIGPGPAVLMIAVTAGGLVWVLGAVVFLLRSR